MRPEIEWGHRYLGWSSQVDGVDLPLFPAPKPPAPPKPTGPKPGTAHADAEAIAKAAQHARTKVKPGSARDNALKQIWRKAKGLFR